MLALLEQGHKVTVIDNLSRGNGGAIAALERLALPNQLFTFILDLAHAMQVNKERWLQEKGKKKMQKKKKKRRRRPRGVKPWG